MKFIKKENYWTSLSDIMTGLMIIFLFIAVSYIKQVEKREQAKDDLVSNFYDIKKDLFNDLKQEFEEDFKDTKWHAVIDEDLSIRFLNEKVLFDYDKSNLKDGFKAILDDFFPRYLNILLDLKYKNQISEVRIEGHTDSKGDYMYNVNLSQSRTRSVLDYVLFQNDGQKYFQSLDSESQNKVKYWLIANGFSSGRTLDDNGEYTIKSGKNENMEKSRRVEFRIVTTSDQILEEILKKIKEK